MRFAHFFVDRPIFASVISLLLLIVGTIAYIELPVAQYPEIAPPTIVVRTAYPGADPQTIADTVSTPIEQEINGVEDMLYMSSYSSADGALSLGNIVGSIHKIGALAQGLPACNGWTFWHFEERGHLHPIDELRADFRASLREAAE